MTHLLREHGQLTDDGVQFVQYTFQDYSTPEEIRRIFDPNSQGLTREEQTKQWRWREAVVLAMVLEGDRCRPARLVDGRIRFDGRSDPGLFATPDGAIVVLVSRRLSTLFRFLVEFLEVDVLESSFRLGTAPRNDVRAWSVFRFLAHALRIARDEEFTRAYVAAARHYLPDNCCDPLQLVPPERFTTRELRRRTLAFDQFHAIAAPLGWRGTVPIPPDLAAPARTKMREWFRFLFPGFVGEPFSPLLRSAISNARSDASFVLAGADDELAAHKALARRIPDVVQIRIAHREIEVVDATMRIQHPWHGFKTAFYAAVLRAIVANIRNETWEVQGIDYRDMSNMRAT